MKTLQFAAVIEHDAESGMFVGIIPNVPGAHSEADTLDKLYANLKEVLELCLEEMTPEEKAEISGNYFGTQMISVAV